MYAQSNMAQSAAALDVLKGATAIAPTPQFTCSVTDPIEYQGKNYARSALKFEHVPFQNMAPLLPIDALKTLAFFMGVLPEGAYIAGGYLASYLNDGPVPSDLDIWVRDAHTYLATAEALERVGKRITGPQVPDGVSQFEVNGLMVQVITIKFFPQGIEEVLDGFDFTVCQFGIDVGAREVVYNPFAPFDYAHRRIVVHRAESDACAHKRYVKYMLKGFKLSPQAREHAVKLGVVSQ